MGVGRRVPGHMPLRNAAPLAFPRPAADRIRGAVGRRGDRRDGQRPVARLQDSAVPAEPARRIRGEPLEAAPRRRDADRAVALAVGDDGNRAGGASPGPRPFADAGIRRADRIQRGDGRSLAGQRGIVRSGRHPRARRRRHRQGGGPRLHLPLPPDAGCPGVRRRAARAGAGGRAALRARRRVPAAHPGPRAERAFSTRARNRRSRPR